MSCTSVHDIGYVCARSQANDAHGAANPRVGEAGKIDLIHCHSPLLNGLPALWVARRLKIPLVYEARAFWEDAAVDHGTFAEGSFRCNVDLPMTGSAEGIVLRGAAGGLKVARSLNEVSREGTRLDNL